MTFFFPRDLYYAVVRMCRAPLLKLRAMDVSFAGNVVVPEIDIKPVKISLYSPGKELPSSPYKGSVEPPPTKRRRTQTVIATESCIHGYCKERGMDREEGILGVCVCVCVCV